MGSRFLVALFGAFLATLAILIGAGYAITQIAVRQPRDPFRTGSFEFDLAPGWWCELEHMTYVCEPPGDDSQKAAAVVVMAMKERNDQDNLQAYEEHLRKPKHWDGPTGGADILSEVRYVKRRRLGTVEWVEALHVGSEIQNYHTYYLATVTSYLGILVTMSVEKNQEAKYVRQLTEMMSTLNVYQR